jgi:hypothetical protein
VHFDVSADGFAPVITHISAAATALDDVVFAVKDRLIVDFAGRSRRRAERRADHDAT